MFTLGTAHACRHLSPSCAIREDLAPGGAYPCVSCHEMLSIYSITVIRSCELGNGARYVACVGEKGQACRVFIG
jgi:hypothetical protein